MDQASVSIKKSPPSAKNLILAGALLIAFFIIYSLIKKSGVFEIFSHLSDPKIGYGLIFIIGILASFHCLGMCGSFVTAYSVAEIKKGKNPSLKIHWQYNLGRFISYTLSGLFLGALGSVAQINDTTSGLLLIIVGSLMLIMGLSLLTSWQPLEKIKLKIPKVIGQMIHNLQNSPKSKGPFIIGLLTAAIPCGPLQAMQLHALSTGNLWQGGLSMAFYAAGTIPLMMALGGFISLLTRDRIKNILKISGVIVMVLGLLTAFRGASDFGFLKKTTKAINEFNGKQDISAAQYFADSIPTDNYQTVEMDITSSGFKPNVIHLRRNLPVRWIIKDGGVTACTKQVILYNGDQELKYQIEAPQTIVKFMPGNKAEVKFSCGIKMVWGKFIFDDTSEPKKSTQPSTCNISGTCNLEQ